MPNRYISIISSLVLYGSLSLSAQTQLGPGDIILLTMASNMQACGLSPLSDEISFACFQDIENGTEIDLTDNGWEHSNPGRWGDGEGTLRMTRSGGTIPRGTVITLQGQFLAGSWIYRTISPDNQWNFTNLNIPGGNFDIDPGGDQVYFMQGGIWDNQGGFANKATYSGRVIYGANNHFAWAADGTIHESNLHPDVLPCNYMAPSNGLSYLNYLKYVGPTTIADHFDWLERMQWWPNWDTQNSCNAFNSTSPSWVGASIPIEDDMALHCAFCNGCSPYTDGLIFDLPPTGLYNVVYTNGVDTFELFDIADGFGVSVDVVEPISFWLISVEEVGGCTLYSNFTGQADITPMYHDAGEYAEYWICADYTGPLHLWYFLNGTPEMGGVWSSPETNLSGDTWHVTDGEGLFTHWISYGHGSPCHPPYDSASVRIHFVDASATIIEVGCDQNGTPYDIYDDRIVFTMTVIAPGFGDDYMISVSSGSITPMLATAGIPQTFTLDPGTAIGPDLTVHIQGWYPLWCEFDFPIPAPGYCSDPCDFDMATYMTGPEDICLENCPDNPATINIEVDGGYFPFKMDFRLKASGYPAWDFINVAMDEMQEITICVDSVPSPVYNPLTGSLTIPAFLAGSTLTFSLLEVSDKFNCTGFMDVTDLFINIHDLPPIHSTILKFCHDEALSVDLTYYDELISTNLDVTWWNGDPLQDGSQIFGATATNLTEVDQLYAQVTDDYCKKSIQVPFTIFPQPELDTVAPLAICQGSIIILQSFPLNDFGNSMAVYSYHAGLPPDSTNILDPTYYIPADSTTIYVLAVAGMCSDTIPIQIFVEDYPDFTLQGQPCNISQGTYTVLFTSTADSIHATAGTVVNNPTGQDAVTGIPNNTNVTIEIINPTGLCKDTFLIIAPNCNCPQLNQPSSPTTFYEICEGEPLPVMSVSVDAGLVADWYNVPSGGIPFLLNSLTYQPPTATNAIYYVEAYDPSTTCNSIRTAITLQVDPVAILQNLADPSLCNDEFIDFNTLVPSVLNGVGGNGSWFDLTTHLPVSGTIQPNNGDAWYYLYTANAGNCLSSDTITAVVNPLPAIALYDILCDDVLLTYQLVFTSDADVIIANTGNLVQTAGTDSFSLQDIPYDTDIQIDLQYAATGCAATILQPAPDCSCPALLQNNNLQVCDDQGTIDLSAYEGPGVNGTWQLVGTPPGSNPATLVGSSFQSLNGDPGNYTLRFIRSVILANCIDTASFQLQLRNSPFADAGSNAVVCAPDNIILSGSAGGSNVQFQWQTNGSGSITNPNALNTTYIPTLADITAGSLSFTLSAVDQTGVCPNAAETITITIDGSAYYILNAPTQTYCDTLNTLIDFDDLITFGNTGGQWFFPDTVSAPVTGSSQINPSTLTAGNYTIFYATTNAVAPCKNDTTAVNLIIENCACPSVAVSSPAQGLCSESDALNLNSLLITSEPGTWSIVGTPAGSKPASINGAQFVTNNSDGGIYQIRFTLTNPVNGCPSTSDITLEVFANPALTVVSAKCAGDLQSWVAVITSSSPALVSSLGNVISLGGSTYQIENIALNTPLQISATSANGLCDAAINIPSPDCECTLSISNLPDQVTLCPNETTELEGQVHDPKGAVTFFWIVAGDSLYQAKLVVSQAGTYTFVTFDELGCRVEHLVDVSIYQEMVPAVSWVDINCPGDQNGQIILQDIQGGNAPFFISVNGGNMQPISSFPYIISNLGAGNYHIDLLDGFSCSKAFDVEVKSASSETLSLGPDLTILVGDSINIDPSISFVPDSFYWTGDVNHLLDPLQLINFLKPETDQVFQLFAIDSKGCVYTAQLHVRVLLNSMILVPNIFSPNGDGVNDFITPMADPSITLIQEFEIFDRWGELVYSAYDFAPNQGNFGWDGTLNNEKMMPAVFVYRVVGINKRGETVSQYGDITLFR